MALPALDLGRRLTPFRIALVYVLVGGAWILFTDQLVDALPVSAAIATRIQTAKGWLFVGVSGLLIYALVAHSRRRLEVTNDRLQRTLQQSSVLHRVLRHNLRNVCNVIALRTERLASLTEDGSEEVAAIRRQTDELLVLAEKSRHLRDVVHGAEPERLVIDLVDVVRSTAESYQATHDHVTIEMDLPERARVLAYPKLEVALEELFENAVEHGSTSSPSQVRQDAVEHGSTSPPSQTREDAGEDIDRREVRIEVAIRSVGDRIALDIADDGPGLPEMERDVLERGMEKPLSHSQGLGLWLVRVIVTESGGDLHIVDNEPRGTIVTLLLETPDDG